MADMKNPTASHPPLARRLAVRVTAADAGCGLLDFLSRRFTYLDRAAWQEEIAAGRVIVNAVSITTTHTLQVGDEVEYHPLPMSEPEVATDYRVVYEDDDLLLIDKPAPLPCHPGGRYFCHTLWALLKEHHDLPQPFFINRLDRETSGLVLVAKNEDTARHCAAQFTNHMVEKEYLVLVEGMFPAPEVTATGWLAPDPESAVRKKMRFYRECPPLDAKACCTEFTRLTTNNTLSLLRARPHTGRCHQIRATLLGLGFPVVGDKLYGVDEKFFLRFISNRLTATDWQRLRIPRQALHASRLTITHPATGRLLTAAVPLPQEVAKLLTIEHKKRTESP